VLDAAPPPELLLADDVETPVVVAALDDELPPPMPPSDDVAAPSAPSHPPHAPRAGAHTSKIVNRRCTSPSIHRMEPWPAAGAAPVHPRDRDNCELLDDFG
jgi:hypothetical protein